jgi:hypothetical protein
MRSTLERRKTAGSERLGGEPGASAAAIAPTAANRLATYRNCIPELGPPSSWSIPRDTLVAIVRPLPCNRRDPTLATTYSGITEVFDSLEATGCIELLHANPHRCSLSLHARG